MIKGGASLNFSAKALEKKFLCVCVCVSILSEKIGFIGFLFSFPSKFIIARVCDTLLEPVIAYYCMETRNLFSVYIPMAKSTPESVFGKDKRL